jgi:hypothetical protein
LYTYGRWRLVQGQPDRLCTIKGRTPALAFLDTALIKPCLEGQPVALPHDVAG